MTAETGPGRARAIRPGAARALFLRARIARAFLLRALVVPVMLACPWPMFGCERIVVLGNAPDAAVGLDGSTSPAPLGEVSWLSGVHAGNDLDAYGAFEAFRQRPLDLAMFFVDRTVGFPGLVEPAWPLDMLADFPVRLVLALPLYPEGAGNNQDCAAGAYDREWQKLGPFLRARGRQDAILRLGWGPNDTAHAWRADADPTAWVACFRRVVDAIRAGGIDPEIAWDFNQSGRPDDTGLDPFAAYPGDDYVDYIGIEAFDRYPPAATESAFRAKCEAVTGLCNVIAFARAHEKRLGLSEWGVVSCGESKGGDSPGYIDWMFGLLVENADVVGFELYYQAGASLCSQLSTPDTPNPNAAARYRYLFGPR